MKKRFLLINNGYPSHKNKHYTSYIKSIKECLEGCDFRVDLLVMSSNFDNSSQKILTYLKYYLKLFCFKNYRDYDFVYINNYPHSFIPLIFHFHKMKEIIIHWHGDDIEVKGAIHKVLNKLSYFFIPKKVKHLSPSIYFSNQISEKLNIEKGSIFVTPSGGVDVELFKPFNGKVSNVQYKIRLGFSSHLSEAKGVDLIIKFMENVKDLMDKRNILIEFHYIKYGLHKDKYSKILKQIDNTVEYNMCKKEEMPFFYNNIDLFLFPTKRSAESLGSVGLEAMACGIPVVGTNDFAIKEYVRPSYDGELFIKGDYKSFQDNLIKCINNIERYTPRQTVIDNYSKNAVIKGYKQFFKKF